MKSLFIALLSTFVLLSCQNQVNDTSADESPKTEQHNPAEHFGIVIHGGAGTILKKNMTDSLEKAYKTKRFLHF